MSVRSSLIALFLTILSIFCLSVAVVAQPPAVPFPYDAYYSGPRFRRGPLVGFGGEDLQLQQLMQNLRPRFG